MANSTSNRLFFWVIIFVVVAGLLWLIGSHWFPWLIQKFTALLLGLFVAVTGLFLRKRK